MLTLMTDTVQRPDRCCHKLSVLTHLPERSIFQRGVWVSLPGSVIEPSGFSKAPICIFNLLSIVFLNLMIDERT